MIDLHYWTTPNGQKILLFLEEAQLPYKIHPVDISKDQQFEASFLKISPNNKIPAIVDNEPIDNQGPLSIFESGAILWYLGEKTSKFIPSNIRHKVEVSEWLYWQVAGLGPMAGQNSHFNLFAKEKIPYAIDRYVKETARLYKVLDTHLKKREWVAGDAYSIADMAIFPWIVPHEMHEQNLKDFPEIKRWYEKILTRPAVKRVYEMAVEINPQIPPAMRPYK